MILERRAIEAEEALRWVTILLVANPEVDKDYREQWLGYWSRLAAGEDVDTPGPVQITSGAALLHWLSTQGFKKSELGVVAEHDEPPAEAQPPEA